MPERVNDLTHGGRWWWWEIITIDYFTNADWATFGSGTVWKAMSVGEWKIMKDLWSLQYRYAHGTLTVGVLSTVVTLYVLGAHFGFKIFKTINKKTCAVQSSWNVMAHVDAREGKRRGNWRKEWVAGTLHTTSEHGVSNITTADTHTSAASSRLNWRLCRFKWTRPFRLKTKSGFCACVITFQTQSSVLLLGQIIFQRIPPTTWRLWGRTTVWTEAIKHRQRLLSLTVT
jgi:hypothetical protein